MIRYVKAMVGTYKFCEPHLFPLFFGINLNYMLVYGSLDHDGVDTVILMIGYR